jgi:anti-sigma B factor antagonist
VSEELAMRVSNLDGRVHLAVEGEIDVATGAEFDASLADAVESTETRLELDLSGVTFFGSEGVAALLRAYRKAQERSISLLIVRSSRHVQRVLDVTGTSQIFCEHPPQWARRPLL